MDTRAFAEVDRGGQSDHAGGGGGGEERRF